MNSPVSRLPIIATAVVFLSGLLLTAWSVSLLHDYAQQRLTAEIKRRYESRAEQLQQALNLGLESLTSVIAFYRANPDLPRSAFNTFAQSDAAFHAGTVALGWVPRVTEKDRQTFIARAREEVPGFSIFEVSGHGMPGFSHGHQDYFPVHHLVSLYGERLKEGMNLATVPSKWRAMERAAELRGIAITRRILLYNGTGQYGFQAFLPLFDDASAGQGLRGYATGLFDISRIVDQVFAGERDWDITLLDTSASSRAQWLYSNNHPKEDQQVFNQISNALDLSLLDGPSWRRSLQVGDRQWLAIFRPYQLADKELWTDSLPFIGLFAGLLITSLMSFYLFLAQLRGQQLFITRQAVKQESELKDAALQETQAKSRFLRAASHDLRQPLNTLGLYVDLARKDLKKGRSVAGHLEQIKAAAGSMQHMFNGLLDLGRLETGQLKAEICNIQIAELLRHLQQDYRPVAESRGLRFRCIPCTGLVTSDPLLLERILRNFLDNALRYTISGSILLGCRRQNGELQIQVIDTGPGMDESVQARLFEEYYRDSEASATSAEGLGLGLAIVAHTAALLGHEYGCRSKPGRGSCFFVCVPHAEAQGITGFD